MFNRFLPILIVSLVTVSGYADSVCNSLAECQQLKARVDARIQELDGVIARYADGRVRHMNQFDAMSYCASRGMHLPSARELAQLAASRGAAGISETAKNGYYPVSAINADGKVDDFYVSYAGYNSPSGDLGNNWFWSSSVFSFSPYEAYVFNGSHGPHSDGGNFGNHSRYSVNFAVRCVVGP